VPENNEASPSESSPNSEAVELVVVEQKPAEDPLAWLTEPERYAYDQFQAKRDPRGLPGTFPLAVSVQLELFELYLAGRSLGEIRALNPKWSLGQIVHAAVERQWNVHRNIYLDQLFARARDRSKQVVAEAAEFLGDQLTAAHKKHGEALRRYIQTGNDEELGAFAVGSPRQYREALELYLKSIGADGTKKVTGTVEHVHTGSVTSALPVVPPSKGEPSKALAGFAAAERERQRKEKLR
jgi:hypothetical protein